ncbi:vitamin K epoxide reductase complex subunit 1-like protein 1 [Gigantopelta aegis]|uniref:vitamin K epoxide reductase complex subunit 1-like protein 1 n=1 Tax=Gigantopelta aegis TaxID=1735272 RepID=UPI001B888F83|nr:vitamin K epoxide reductase complex subunit 1-like protein 1 [Gigantopelta aegis]
MIRRIRLKNVDNAILILCSLGLAVSAYALHVEIAKERDHSFTAMCDFSETVSCSKVFTSRYGRGFGLVDRIFSKDSILNQPNSVFGIIFYLLQAVLVLSPSLTGASVQFFTAILSNAGSIYLSCILYFVLQDLCVVCVTTYIINFILLMCSYITYKQALTGSKKKHS